MYSRQELVSEYISDWNRCIIGQKRRDITADLKAAISTIRNNMLRYQEVEMACGVPWWFTAILHYLEASGDMTKHLHNGDDGKPDGYGLLTKRTVNVPKGRPNIDMPCSWELSAVDALVNNPDNPNKQWGANKVRRVNGVPDWSLPTVLWRFEVWNGMGYRMQHIRSPYLWAGSNLEQPGRYVADGSFDATAWSKQIGAAVILKEMCKRKIIKVDGVL